MKRGALGRADLIRWADSLDEGRLQRLALELGYRELPEMPVSGSLAPLTGAFDGVVTDEDLASDTSAPIHRQYRLIERRSLAPPPPTPIPTPPQDADERPVPPLGPPPPLVPWPRLWPLLRAALGERAERRHIDLPRVVIAVSRARPLRRLPRLKGQRWAPRGQLILDLHPRLYPFWGDFDALKDALPRLRGAAGLDILRMDEGPSGPVQAWDGSGWGPPQRYTAPPAGTRVLIAGDLGCLGSLAQRQAWAALGRRLAGAGSPPVALTPCPPRWWDPALAGLYYPVTLDRAASIPAKPAGPRPWPARPVDLNEAVRSDPGALRLLTLLCACIGIPPALLRHLRHRLPVHLADVGSEAAAWLHPAFVAGDFALLPDDPAEIERLREAYRTTGDAAQRDLAWQLIRARQDTTTRAERMEERVLHAAMLGRTDPEAEAFLDRVAEAIDQARDRVDPEHARFLTAWVNRRATRTHPGAWTHSPRSEALWLLAHPEAEAEGAALPAGFELHRAQAALGRAEQPQFWCLVQRGERLEVEPFSAPDTAFTSGSPIVEQFPTLRPVAQVREDRPRSVWRSLPLRDGIGLSLTETGWRLRTAYEELLIVPLTRPAWAHTLGRDGKGLFVGFDDGQGDRRAYWCSAGRGHPDWLEPRQSSFRSLDIEIKQGFFLDAVQFRALWAEGLRPPRFADALTIDAQGIRTEIKIKGVTHGFRWIWPGRFLMGSPQTEDDRDDDERQHEVILTRGLWLAEIACTQALWQAVMGENPSRFKGVQRPVEQVCWDDVQRFMARLNEEAPGLGARLPTEAEWEYACRAGTTTAYSFGDDFDPRQANNGDETVAVGTLPANPWGFYEMHGNVMEWCQDWFGDYPSGPVLDPAGPDTGEGRVLRGGGWIIIARLLRSAYRNHSDPGVRNGSVGFRLALGPELGQEKQASQEGAGPDSPRKERAVASGRRGRSGPAERS